MDHEENCKSSSLRTFKMLHRPNGGGEEDEEGDRVGGSTSEEDGEEDKAGEAVETSRLEFKPLCI